ncbi:ComEA family DNA-binding protein [Anaerorhabdus sp.]|jgi:competence protein ComEA|uniref:ComEA family DNA-binding protein n=1 Tax=Anaerorhabdus sp. TaxID=1872524 RepID=UPI002FC9C01A
MKKLLIFLFAFSILIPNVQPITLINRECNQIEIKGEVVEATILCMKPTSTIKDALSHVTLKETADMTNVNLSIVLAHGDIINIPKYIEQTRISINFSSLDELMTLPGIGKSTANKIINYRNTHGLFKTLEDIMNIPGIKISKYNKIKDKICL